jgi:hypothetical protein
MTIDRRFHSRSARPTIALAALNFAPESLGSRLKPSRFDLVEPPAPRLSETSANDV